jgi:predicted HTH transcriptional regulator
VETIIELININPNITQKDLMDKLKLSRTGVEWHIKKLKESGKLIRKGNSRGKGGYWKINL